MQHLYPNPLDSTKQTHLIPPIANLQPLRRLFLVRQILRLILALGILRTTRSLLLILRRATADIFNASSRTRVPITLI